MADFGIFVLLGWIIWSIVNALIAVEKGRSGGGIFAMSLFISPMLGYLYILAVPPLPKKVETEEDAQGKTN